MSARVTLLLLLGALGCSSSPEPPDAALDRPPEATTPADGTPPLDTAVRPDAEPPPEAAVCGSAGQPCCVGSMVCHASLVCRDGRCVSCGDDMAACDGACRDIASDPMNCGACGRSCRADQRCAGGACVCAEGRTACGGACVDVLRDEAHCGACGRGCAGVLPGAMARCTQGRCALDRCAEGRADCNGDEADGCEATLSSDTANCGRCGARCDALPGRAVRCEAGRCVDAETCTAPRGDCTMAPGCETDLSRSVVHCGACGRACSTRGGVARCAAGACAITCDAGRGDCDGDGSNGCEADLSASTSHCGACGRRCTLPHATADCTAGRCAVGACEGGWGDCDGDATNGCERELSADAEHCGACGRACVRVGAEAACTAGRCGLGRCAVGRGDCDGNEANGCEVDVASEARHCGMCGRSCRGDQVCREGACACREGAVACGAECVDTRRDPRHCGGCGTACTSGICSDSLCTTAASQRSCVVLGTPGCGLVEIPAGTFTMGAQYSCGMTHPDPATCGGVYTSPAMPDTFVSAIAVDAYEVTVARFRAFMRVRMQALADIRARPVAYRGRSIAWDRAAAPLFESGTSTCMVTANCTWTSAPGRFEALPMVGVDVWTAQEFCVWDGGRLPTEAEWEYVARGRSVPAEGLLSGRTYPWGQALPGRCDRAQPHSSCMGDQGTIYRAVGSFAPSGGVFDLSGNALELCVDHFDFYGAASTSCWRTPPYRDPLCRLANPASQFAVRSYGLWSMPDGVQFRATERRPLEHNSYAGFRCVRSR